MNAALRFMLAQDDEQDRAHLRRALRRWLFDPSPRGQGLHGWMGLSKRSARCELRNAWLRRAAETLGNDPDALADTIRTFQVRRMKAWQRTGGPPADAKPIDMALFHAAQQGAPIDLTARQLANIIG